MNDLNLLKSIRNNEVEDFSLKDKEFVGKVVDVYDGDTCKVVFYFDNKLVKFTCRLYGINCPEIKPSKTMENREDEIQRAKHARNKLVSLCCNCEKVDDSNYKEVIHNNVNLVKIKCRDWDKYGRLLIDIQEHKEEINEKVLCFNDLLLEGGFAKKYIL